MPDKIFFSRDVRFCEKNVSLFNEGYIRVFRKNAIISCRRADFSPPNEFGGFQSVNFDEKNRSVSSFYF